MVRGLFVTLILGAVALAFTGCHAEGSAGVSGNSASSIALPR